MTGVYFLFLMGKPRGSQSRAGRMVRLRKVCRYLTFFLVMVRPPFCFQRPRWLPVRTPTFQVPGGRRNDDREPKSKSSLPLEKVLRKLSRDTSDNAPLARTYSCGFIEPGRRPEDEGFILSRWEKLKVLFL